MAGHDSQALKGILSMLLLKVLDTETDYGYSVVVRLQELGFDGLAEGTVYPALSRLESKGLLRSELVASDVGPARKYYRPTDAGLRELTQATDAWVELRANVDGIMSTATEPFNPNPNPKPNNINTVEVAR